MTPEIDFTGHPSARQTYDALLSAAEYDKREACIVAIAFLEVLSADMPDVPFFPGHIRRCAMSWASLANQIELEAYLVAAIGELQDSPLMDKQAKRLAALAWHKMNSDSRAAFKKWIAEHE